MNAHALKVDKQAVTSARGNRTAGRKLSIDNIKSSAKGAPVAKYIFPFFQTSGLSNETLASILGYKAHSNMSMVRTGAAKLPVIKAPQTAEALEIPDTYEFGRLVAENNMPDEVMALEQMGVIVSKQERRILDMIHENIPAGDMKDFENRLKELFAQ